MVADYRTRNQCVVAVAESPRGTEGAPTVGSNAIKARATTWRPSGDSLQTDYNQSSISATAPVPGGLYATLDIPTYLRGAGTAGQAPDFGVLLRGCSMAETLTAAAVTGTAQAGAASTITLAAGASAVNDAYKGMPITITAGTGANQEARVITAYNGTTKVATVFPNFAVTPDGTSQYSIPANARYKPITASPEAITAYQFKHRNNAAENSRRSRLVGAAGSFRIGVQSQQYATIDFSFRGLVPGNPDDVTHPGTPTYQSQLPERVAGAQSYLGASAASGVPVKLSSFDFDLAVRLDQFDDITSANGYDIADALDRVPAGRLVPNMMLNSTRDAFADWRANTIRLLWLNWGSAIGKRVSLFQPQIVHNGYEQSDVRGFGAEVLPYRSVEADGEIWICIW